MLLLVGIFNPPDLLLRFTLRDPIGLLDLTRGRFSLPRNGTDTIVSSCLFRTLAHIRLRPATAGYLGSGSDMHAPTEQVPRRLRRTPYGICTLPDIGLDLYNG